MKIENTYYIYILKCSDDSYYTGITNDIERRMFEHETGYDKTCYTYNRRPVVVKFCDFTNDVNIAIAWEKQIKGWTRKKKEALFKGDWEELVRLARNHQGNNRDESDRPSTSSG